MAPLPGCGTGCESFSVAFAEEGRGASSYEMSSTTRTFAGALRMKWRREECSSGRSFPVRVRELPPRMTFTRPERLRSASASLTRLLYSAAAIEIIGSDFFMGAGATVGASGFFSAGAAAAGTAPGSVIGVVGDVLPEGIALPDGVVLASAGGGASVADRVAAFGEDSGLLLSSRAARNSGRSLYTP